MEFLHYTQRQSDRRPAANSVYVAIAGEVVNGQFSASNLLLHIHANR